MVHWITAWSQAHADMSMLCKNIKDYTVRLTVFSDISGEQVRLKLSNQEGKAPVTIAGLTVQVEDHLPIVITFNGIDKICLKPGEYLYSDPLEMPVMAGQLITVSIAFSGAATSGNILPECVRVSTKGNYTQTSSMPVAKQPLWMKLSGVDSVLPVLSSVELLTEEKKRVLVCFGDSITQMSRWTKPLTERIRNTNQDIVVVNKGIGGNMLLSNPVDKMSAMFGIAGLKRFKTDVLDVVGATDLIIALGVNDFNRFKDSSEIKGKAEKIYDSYRELTGLARSRGMKVYVATVTPSEGCKGYQALSEEERKKLNEMVRTGNDFDAVLDFDAVIRDSDHLSKMKEYCDSGDHVHPGVIGGIKMAEEVYKVISEAGA